MIVLQVLPSLHTGGVERGTVEMVQAIAAAGGKAVVASAGGRMVPQVERAGGQHVRLPLTTKDPMTLLGNAHRLRSLIRSEGVELVHARSRAPAWSALLAARREGVPFVTTYHGAYGEGGLGAKRLYNSVMARGDRVIAISRFIARLVAARHGVEPDRLRLIPRGVDTEVFDPAAVNLGRVARLAEAWRLLDGAPVVMLPGRITRWKGQMVLLDAMTLLDRQDALCVLVGTPQSPRFAAAVAERARMLGLQNRLRFAGECDDMPAALMLADALVHASTRPEPFGRTVVEAQAMGRPVVASDAGGAVETVEQDVTGWRVPPGDSMALAAVLNHVLALPAEERARHGAAARAAVQERFMTKAMQAATLDVYRELLPSV